jgi:serine protease Do
MGNSILASVALLPLLLNVSQAAQSVAIDPQTQPWGYSSEETGTGSYLGVDVSDVTKERMSALKLKEEKGVEITMVDQDAPAGKAGIHEHDVILTMNGNPVDSGAQLRRMIHEIPPGRVVEMGLSRDGQPLTLKVQLGDKRKEFAVLIPKSKSYSYSYTVPPMPNMPDIEIPEINVLVVRSSARSGLMVENLTQQLGEFFGIHDGNGVLVRSVEKGSRADKAGLRAGDVIVKVNDNSVHDTDDFTRALRSHNGGSNTVGVIRDKKEQNLNLTLPERDGSGESYGSGSGSGSGSGELEQEDFDSDSALTANAVQMRQLAQQLAELQPKMNLTSKSLQKADTQARQDLCAAQQRARTELRKKVREQERLKNKVQDQMERMRHELTGEWLDI